MKFYTWCNSKDNHNLIRLNDSANMNGIAIESIGEGRDINEGGGFNGKNLWLYEKVCELDENEIVVCTDAFDVIYLTNADEIKQKFLKMNAKIVYSADHRYAHQLPKYRSFFDEMAKNKHFKYLNAGAMIGYAKNIKEMFEVIFEYDYNSLDPRTTCDQGFIGKYFIENPGKIKLDYDCEIFWTDFDFSYPDSYGPFRGRRRLRELFKNEEYLLDKLNSVIKHNRMYNKITNSYPCIFHAAGQGARMLDALINLIKNNKKDKVL